jgi:FKBP-type peptidyl-prolyl cis-trans isomerase
MQSMKIHGIVVGWIALGAQQHLTVLGWTTTPVVGKKNVCLAPKMTRSSMQDEDIESSIVVSNQEVTATVASSMMMDRRAALAGSVSSALLLLVPSSVALAQPQEFANVGTQAPPPAGEEDRPFVTLANGVKVKDFKEGIGTETVNGGSRVFIKCTGRLLNLNGVVFYSTKNNNPDGFGPEPLVFTLGKGEALPGLESGLMGMKKDGIRRIIVPADLAYSKYPQLEPKPMSPLDQRALDSVVNNPRRDATILFDVQVERIK